jgi:hypothetical protein
MATIKQINANRANSAKSTGPRTTEGKSATRFNALKSGVRATAEIIPNETKEDLDALTAQFHQQFAPATPEEVALVDIVVRNEWLLRRMAMVEGSYWDLKVRRKRGHPPDETDLIDKDFTRLQWRLNSIQRNLFTALDRLKTLQAAREPVDPEPVNTQLASFGSDPGEPHLGTSASCPAIKSGAGIGSPNRVSSGSTPAQTGMA